jgi:hypothetical protein
VFDGMDFSRLRVHPCDFHASVEAHRILGEETDRQLSDSGFLEAKAR